MRLGGPTFADISTPESWIAELQRWNYRAAYCPLKATAGDAEVQAYAEAAKAANIVIAEVGAWSNPLNTEESERCTAIAYCQQQLDLAERIGACCCVNIAGSRGAQWDGPHPDNLTLETFDRIVETTREIIDAVQPKRTFFTLETMPWSFPDSPDSYLALLRAIDRPAFAVHLDPANLINCPSRFLDNAMFIRECFGKLGRYIKSCHAKDITLAGKMTVHLDEVAPGKGGLDYAVFLRELSRLGPDTPLMLEHLQTPDEYTKAADYLRQIATEQRLSL